MDYLDPSKFLFHWLQPHGASRSASGNDQPRFTAFVNTLPSHIAELDEETGGKASKRKWNLAQYTGNRRPPPPESDSDATGYCSTSLSQKLESLNDSYRRFRFRETNGFDQPWYQVKDILPVRRGSCTTLSGSDAFPATRGLKRPASEIENLSEGVRNGGRSDETTGVSSQESSLSDAPEESKPLVLANHLGYRDGPPPKRFRKNPYYDLNVPSTASFHAVHAGSTEKSPHASKLRRIVNAKLRPLRERRNIAPRGKKVSPEQTEMTCELFDIEKRTESNMSMIKRRSQFHKSSADAIISPSHGMSTPPRDNNDPEPFHHMALPPAHLNTPRDVRHTDDAGGKSISHLPSPPDESCNESKTSQSECHNIPEPRDNEIPFNSLTSTFLKVTKRRGELTDIESKQSRPSKPAAGWFQANLPAISVPQIFPKPSTSKRQRQWEDNTNEDYSEARPVKRLRGNSLARSLADRISISKIRTKDTQSPTMQSRSQSARGKDCIDPLGDVATPQSTQWTLGAPFPFTGSETSQGALEALVLSAIEAAEKDVLQRALQEICRSTDTGLQIVANELLGNCEHIGQTEYG
ncbi:hypothetical protein BU16DRAFT_543524 [Lophium mytilinum]|uniref:Uncharacterized protein n=1 Tax=Lophium mytilinum TaxID=390894 RepID=A0A6A6QDU2_9PEZI|nr:hypothetical protein BU16DRAFT_543524 [Lophium mytilinum]